MADCRLIMLCVALVACSEGQDGVKTTDPTLTNIDTTTTLALAVTDSTLFENGTSTSSVSQASSSSMSSTADTMDPAVPTSTPVAYSPTISTANSETSTSTISTSHSPDVSSAASAHASTSTIASTDTTSGQVSTITTQSSFVSSSTTPSATSSISETTPISSTLQTSVSASSIETSITTPSSSSPNATVVSTTSSAAVPSATISAASSSQTSSLSSAALTTWTSVKTTALSTSTIGSTPSSITYVTPTSAPPSEVTSSLNSNTPPSSPLVTGTSENTPISTSPLVSSSQSSVESSTSFASVSTWSSSIISSTQPMVSTDVSPPRTTVSASEVTQNAATQSTELLTSTDAATTKPTISESPNSTTNISQTSNPPISPLETTHTQSTAVSSVPTSPESDTVIPTMDTSTEDTANTTNPTYHSSAAFHYKILLKFNGDCDMLKNDEEFRAQIFDALSTTFLTFYNISKEDIDFYRLSCSPAELVVNFRNTDRHTVDLLVQTIVINSVNKLNADTFSLTEAQMLGQFSDENTDIGYLETELEFTDILIISISSFMFFVLLLMCIVMVCRECVRRKRGHSFTLTEVPHVNTKLADFSLTKIPRPKVIYDMDGITEANGSQTSKFIGQLKYAGCQSGWSVEDDVCRENRLSINADDIRVRMSDCRDGLVVGVTSRYKVMRPENNTSSVSDDVNRNLIPMSNSPLSGGLANPGFLSDDVTANKDVEKDDELEMML